MGSDYTSKVSDSHEHNDGTHGPDIYISKGNERVGKIHVSDRSGKTEEGRGALESIGGVIASLWKDLTE